MKSDYSLRAAIVITMFIAGFGALPGFSQNAPKPPARLVVLWASGDSEVARNVAFMYAHKAKKAGWFYEVTLIVGNCRDRRGASLDHNTPGAV